MLFRSQNLTIKECVSAEEETIIPAAADAEKDTAAETEERAGAKAISNAVTEARVLPAELSAERKKFISERFSATAMPLKKKKIPIKTKIKTIQI